MEAMHEFAMLVDLQVGQCSDTEVHDFVFVHVLHVDA
jgi:hypothetical protein